MILAVKYIKDENKVCLINTDFLDSGMKTVTLEMAETLIDRLENDFQLDYYRRSLTWVTSVPLESQERMLMADGYYDEQLQRWKRVKVLTTFGRRLAVTTTQLNSLLENKATLPLYRDLRLFKYLETRRVTQVHIICGEGDSTGDYSATGLIKVTNKTPTKPSISLNYETDYCHAVDVHTPILSQRSAPCYLVEGNAKQGSSTLSMLAIVHEDFETNDGVASTISSTYDRLAEIALIKGVANRSNKEETALEVYRRFFSIKYGLYPGLELEKILMVARYLETGYDNPYPIYLLPLLKWASSQYGNYQLVGTNIDTKVYKDYIDQVVAREDALSLFMQTDGRELGEVIAFGDTIYGYKLNEKKLSSQGGTQKVVIDIRGYAGVAPFALLGYDFVLKYFWVNTCLKKLDISNYKDIKLVIDGASYDILSKVLSPNCKKIFNLGYYHNHSTELIELITHIVYSQLLNMYTQQHLSPVELNINVNGVLAEFLVMNNEHVENTRVAQFYDVAVLNTAIDLCISNNYGNTCSICLNNNGPGIPISYTDEEMASMRTVPINEFGLSRLLLSHAILALGLTRYTGDTETYKIVDVEWLPFSREADNYQLFGNKAVFIIGKNKVVVTLDKSVPIVVKYKTLQIGILNNNNFFNEEETDIDLYTECLDRIQAVLLENKYPIGKTVELRSQECEDVVSKATRLYGEYREHWRCLEW